MPIIRDRTADLPPNPKQSINVQESDDSDDSDDEDESDDEADFYEEVADIKLGLTRLDTNIKNLDILFTESISKTKSKERAIRIEELIGETSQICTILRDKLKAMKAEISTISSTADNPDANIRSRVNIQRTLAVKFLDLMRRYQEIQNSHESHYQDRTRRQASLVYPDKSPQEIDAIVNSGTINMTILEDNRQHSEAAVALINIKEQHQDIKKLEASILELHQIFIDVNSLIESQDDLVDQIEFNCEQACAWTGIAQHYIEDANDYVTDGRKRCCKCCAYGTCAACASCAVVTGYIAIALAPLAACNVM
jgi:t-SNARE complex subunit (syntaxin)